MPDKSSHSLLPDGNVFPVPAACLQGNLAETLFWDAVFYLLATHGETNPSGYRFVETRYSDLQNLADLSRKTLRKMIDMALQLDEPYRLWEEEGIQPYSFRLMHKQYQEWLEADKFILKPAYYMENGWAWVLAQPYPNSSKKTRLPLAVINVLFRRPHGQTASFHEIVSRCRNKKKPPDAAEVEKAMAHLAKLKLINKVEPDQFRLVRERFHDDGRVAWQQIQSPDPTTPNSQLLQWANKIDPQRAVLTEEIIRLGHFDSQRHFKEIFFDLASVQNGVEIDWLKYVVKRKQGYRLTSRRRWRSIWKSYERKLRKEMFGSESKKVKFDLGQGKESQAKLSLDNHYPNLLRWGKLVVWVYDARYQFCHLRRPETVQIMLARDGHQVCQFQLHCEDEVVRCDLAKDLRTTHSAIYYLFVEVERPLHQFSIAARLEAEYLPQQEE